MKTRVYFYSILLGMSTIAIEAQGLPDTTPACPPIYLTLDTGNMRNADAIAGFLRERKIKATFFLSNEKTTRGDHALDHSWTAYWQDRYKEGHAFGSHTFNHGRILPATGDTIGYRPQFGNDAGSTSRLSAEQFCAELKAVDTRFHTMTGAHLDPLWRAPGGRLTPVAQQAAQACGFRHVGWSSAGFLGDELDSRKFSNRMLTERALRTIRAGDVLLAHLGIWSRQEDFLPALKDIVTGLQSQGYCFKTLRDARP
ncbi:MAG: polysaccharide deacetylase family protein [Burkholderiaceae bacterium]